MKACCSMPGAVSYSRRVPTLIASGGLMLAMAACLLVALLAIALSTPDPAIPDPGRVVLLDFKGNIPGQPIGWFTGAPIVFRADAQRAQGAAGSHQPRDPA